MTLEIIEIQTEGLRFQIISKEVILKIFKDLSTNLKQNLMKDSPEEWR